MRSMISNFSVTLKVPERKYRLRDRCVMAGNSAGDAEKVSLGASRVVLVLDGLVG